MARKPNPTPERLADGTDSRALATINGAANELAAAEQLAMEQAELYRVVGRIEAAHFLETVSSRMIGESYLSARTLIGKLGSITVRGADGNAKRVSSLEDFCEAAMPVSHRRCQQIAQAMHTLGPALFEQAETLGLGHRAYSAIRALPGDMQAEVKAAIASGDKEQVLTLVEELAARNASLKTENDEQAKVLAARQRMLDKEVAKTQKLQEAEYIRRNGTRDEREAAQLDDLRDAGLAGEQVLQQLVTAVDAVMSAPATEAAELAARQTVDYVVQRLADALEARGIAVNLMGERIDPAWAKQIAQAAAEGQRSKKRT